LEKKVGFELLRLPAIAEIKREHPNRALALPLHEIGAGGARQRRIYVQTF
jgi:hypothetical protein